MKKPETIVIMDNIRTETACVGCGTKENTKQFGLQTTTYGNSRQVLTYCPTCAEQVADYLIGAWEESRNQRLYQLIQGYYTFCDDLTRFLRDRVATLNERDELAQRAWEFLEE